MNPDKEKWLEYRTRISMGLGLEGEQTRWIFNKALDAIEHTENVKIEKKYDQSLDVIVGLSNDIQDLKSKCIEWSANYGEAHKEIKRLKHEATQYLGELINKTNNERLIERYTKRMDELNK